MCAYDLPGGAIAMQFLDTSAGFTLLVPDGTGGQFDEGTFELTILEATGIYTPFEGGHNPEGCIAAERSGASKYAPG
jgi:hypothetical protein